MQSRLKAINGATFRRIKSGGASTPTQPLQFISANDFFPAGNASGAPRTFAVPSSGTGVSRRFLMSRHFIGGGDVSVLKLSWIQAAINAGNGVIGVGNGYTVVGAVVVYNGTYAPVYFSGLRTNVINDLDTDIQSDDILPAAFGATKFAQGDYFDLKEVREYANSSTAKEAENVFNTLADSQIIAYNPAICTATIDSTASFWNGGAFNAGAGVFGTDYVNGAPASAPLCLGRFVIGSPKVVAIAGDSKAFGTGDSSTAAAALGLSRALYPTSSSPTGAYAGCNFGCASGVAADWATANFLKMTAYLKYANIGIEAYRTNGGTAADSQAIHAQMRAGLVGRKQLIRLSLTPRTTSIDNWMTEIGQTAVFGWSTGGTIDTFQQAMQALVASDFTYFDSTAQRGSNYWKWVVDAPPLTAQYSTSDGLHENPLGYELRTHSNGSIVALSGTTTGTLKSIIDAFV